MKGTAEHKAKRLGCQLSLKQERSGPLMRAAEMLTRFSKRGYVFYKCSTTKSPIFVVPTT